MEKAKEMRSQFESSRGAKSSFFSHLQTGLFSSCPAVIKTYILCLLELSGWVKFVQKPRILRKPRREMGQRFGWEPKACQINSISGAQLFSARS